jgi:pimeloyl-ACP methyl ester carboxylesterase
MDAENRFLARLPPGFPVGRSERRAWIRGYARFGRRCGRRNRRLLAHVSTAESAKDLDLLRRAVGARRLNYRGVSYGTLLGATYANLFPNRVKRMVLDGNVDPVAWAKRPRRRPFLSTSLRLRSDKASAKTLNAFLRLCGRAGTANCAFSAGSAAATRAKWVTLLQRLGRHPVTIPTTPPQTFTYATLLVAMSQQVLFVGQGAAGIPGWRDDAQLLQAMWTSSEPGAAPREHPPAASPGLGPRVRSGGRWSSAGPTKRYAGSEQAIAVECSDSPNPRNPAAFGRVAALSFARAGDIGPSWAWNDEPCASWPARAADRYSGPWNRRTANPVLVIGNTYDPSTAYRGAVAMARDLARARLLTVNGYGHTELLNPSACAHSYESRYFIRGTLPPRGTRCRQDRPPFSPGP